MLGSFTTRIDFLDIESNRFSIFVSGMADNSILTTQPFLYKNEHQIGVKTNGRNKEKNNNINGQGHEYIVVPKLELKSKRISTGNSISMQHELMAMLPDDLPRNILCDISVLIRYMEANCYLKFDSNIDNFPQDLIQSNGKMIFDAVQFLSGKKIPGLKLGTANKKGSRSGSAKMNSNRSKLSTARTSTVSISKQDKTDRENGNGNGNENEKENSQAQIERLIHNYAQFINFLKAHGALITIRPEYCLSCTQYIQFVQISSTMSSQPVSSTDNGNRKGIKFNELKSSKFNQIYKNLKDWLREHILCYHMFVGHRFIPNC